MTGARESKAGEKGTFKPINVEQTQNLPGFVPCNTGMRTMH